jgi:hypothetical protein
MKETITTEQYSEYLRFTLQVLSAYEKAFIACEKVVNKISKL